MLDGGRCLPPGPFALAAFTRPIEGFGKPGKAAIDHEKDQDADNRPAQFKRVAANQRRDHA